MRKNEDARAKQKNYYDLKVRGATPEVGDNVLVRKLAFNGKHKLEDKWEPDVYRITGKQNPDIPVYEVMRNDGTGKKRMLHRNHLMPLLQTLRDTPLGETSNAKRRSSSSSDSPDLRVQHHANESSDAALQRNADESYDEISYNVEKNEPHEDTREHSEHSSVESDSRSGDSDTDDDDQDSEDESDSVRTQEGDDIPGGEENEDDDDIPDSEENEDEDIPDSENEEGEDSDKEEHEGEDSDSDSEPDTDSDETHVNDADTKSLRRSTRTRRPPDRYGVAISHQHHTYSDWKDRVTVLIRLVDVFPHKSDDLYKHIMYLVIG